MKSYTHTTGTYIGKGGVEIFFQSWTVPSPRGILVIAHGIGEHSGRYKNIVETLNGLGISVYANDHRGHGKSGGLRGHVDSFMDYIYDVKLLVDFIREDNHAVPLILLGHSMGGTIAFKYALNYPDDLRGLILSSAAFVITAEAPSWKISLGNYLSRYLPSFATSNGLNTADLSRDQNVVEAYENDPLVHDRISARLFTEFTAAAAKCLDRAKELKVPLLMFHGKDDRIVDHRGSKTAYDSVSSKDKTLLIFEGYYHETMNEPKVEREKVLLLVKQWIVKILGKAKASRKKTASAKRVKPKKTKTPVTKKTSKAKKKSVKKTKKARRK